MDNQLFTGALVRLAAEDPATDAANFTRWDRDTEYTRLLEVHPVLVTREKQWRERLEEVPGERHFWFSVVTLVENKLIGHVGIFMVRYQHGDCMVGIGIGEPDYRGKGYGTDALRVALRFAFRELNMHRVSLTALATNTRALRSYEKCGFVYEGILRGAEYRDHLRSDIVAMGTLQREWEKVNGQSTFYR